MLLYFFSRSKILDTLVGVRVFRVTLTIKKTKGAGIPRTSFLFEAGWALRAEEEKHGKKFFWSVANNPACRMIDEKCTYIGMINISRENISSYIWDNYGCTNSNSCLLQFQFLAWNWLEFEMELTGIGIGTFLEIVIQHARLNY